MAQAIRVRLPGPIADVRVRGETGADRADAPAQPAPEQIEQAVARRLAPEVEALRRARAALEQGATQVRELAEQARKQAEDNVLALALEIAGKVLMQEVQGGRYDMEPIVRAALERLPNGREVTVHLHPDDLARCEMARQAQGEGGAAGGVRFVADPQVAPAACRVASPQGVVHSDVETNLASVAAALQGSE